MGLIMDNFVIMAADVDIANDQLIMLLDGSVAKQLRVVITLNADNQRLASVLGTSSLNMLKGRCVRAVIEDGKITNLCHIIEDFWLLPTPSPEAEACELDTKNEP